MTDDERNNLQTIITQTLNSLKEKYGDKFDLNKVSVAFIMQVTNLSRGKVRTLKKHGFVVQPNGHTGTHKSSTVLTGFTGLIDDQLQRGNANSSSILVLLVGHGYKGSQTTIKNYISRHKDLLPVRRPVVAPQGDRCERYTSEPGKSYQMDWGFVLVEQDDGATYRAACFAMICHHCNERYIEFFPDARQEHLFIGMIHAFMRMGVPETVLTDNMKSVVVRRDEEGHPIWNNEYAEFMKAIGFTTKLCKPGHAYTKGDVERLVGYVKNNFMSGRVFGNITDLNYEALRWCDQTNSNYCKKVGCSSDKEHNLECRKVAQELKITKTILNYLYVERRVSFDGFVTFEGRRFGVPYWYHKRVCRVGRKDYTLYIYSDDMKQKLAEHDVTWSRRDSFCKDQFCVKKQPEEHPTAPVTTVMHQTTPKATGKSLDGFNFDKEVEW